MPVADLSRTEAFYTRTLGARVGRRTETWIDLWLFGAQLTAYQRPDAVTPPPYRDAQHLGATLDWAAWTEFADRLERAGVAFRLPPSADMIGGRAKMTLADPDGYLIELKAYRDPSTLGRPADA